MIGWVITFAASGAIGLNLYLVFSLINDLKALRGKVHMLQVEQDIVSNQIGKTLKLLLEEHQSRSSAVARIERELMEPGERLQ